MIYVHINLIRTSNEISSLLQTASVSPLPSSAEERRSMLSPGPERRLRLPSPATSLPVAPDATNEDGDLILEVPGAGG